jgi:hypothetical protein
MIGEDDGASDGLYTKQARLSLRMLPLKPGRLQEKETKKSERGTQIHHLYP